MKKKIVTGILSLAMTTSLIAGCGSSATSDSTASGTDSTVSSTDSTTSSADSTDSSLKNDDSTSSGADTADSTVSSKDSTDSATDSTSGTDGTVILTEINGVDLTTSADIKTMESTAVAFTAMMKKVSKESAKDVWPSGYHLEDVPMILCMQDEDGSVKSVLAVDSPKIPDGWKTEDYEYDGSQGELKSVVRVSLDGNDDLKESMEALAQFQFLEFGGTKYYCTTATPANGSVQWAKFIELMTHENFHEFVQMADWKDTESLVSRLSADEAADFNEDSCKLSLMSYNRLMEMHNMDEDELKEALPDWLFVKSEIYNKYPGLKKQSEIELLEGSAEYASIKIMDHAKGMPDGKISNGLERIIKGDIIEIIKNAYPGSSEERAIGEMFTKDFYYFTGLSMNYILSKTVPDWTERLADHQTQYDILMSEFMPEGYSEDASRLEKLKSQWGYDDYTEAAKKLAEVLPGYDPGKNVNIDVDKQIKIFQQSEEYKNLSDEDKEKAMEEFRKVLEAEDSGSVE